MVIQITAVRMTINSVTKKQCLIPSTVVCQMCRFNIYKLYLRVTAIILGSTSDGLEQFKTVALCKLALTL